MLTSAGDKPYIAFSNGMTDAVVFDLSRALYADHHPRNICGADDKWRSSMQTPQPEVLTMKEPLAQNRGLGLHKWRLQPDPRQKTSVLGDLGDLVKNGSWITLLLVTVFYFTGLLIRGNVMLSSL